MFQAVLCISILDGSSLQMFQSMCRFSRDYAYYKKTTEIIDNVLRGSWITGANIRMIITVI